jgi:hypothetical protein
MKLERQSKMKKILPITLFTIAYAILLSLGIECFLYSLGMLFGFSLGSPYDPFGYYPVFLPFCLIIGVVSLVLLVFLFIINLIKSEKLKYTKKLWLCQIAVSIFGAILLIKPWEILFDFLIEIW